MLLRSHGRCELCGQPITQLNWEDHHVFLKSHLSAQVHNELWNRVALHSLCHQADSPRKTPHNDRATREFLENIAIARLQRQLAPQVLRFLLGHQQGMSASAFIRAYEKYRAGGFFLDVQLEPGAIGEN